MYQRLAAAALVLVLFGCNGMRGERMDGEDDTGGVPPGDMTGVGRDTQPGTPAETTAVGGGAGAAGGAGGVTAEQVSLGNRIFHGRVAQAICYSCHGQNGGGTDTAPDLTDNEWINIDGSLAEIERVVREGVSEPREHPAPMPPMGGSRLTDEQVRAVSAYVYSLSHPDEGR